MPAMESRHLFDVKEPLQEFDTHYEDRYRILWGFFNPRTIPSFTASLIADIYEHDCALNVDEQGTLCSGVGRPVDFYVWASRTPGFYSLGGDLAHFVNCIKMKNRDGLMHYASQCIDALYLRVRSYRSSRVITIALIQGDALGGGFEAALASDIIIAEEHARFGLPEILFNLFPGMGAYSILARRIGPVLTEKIMTSGTTYSAAECYEMGLVNVLASKGKGEDAVYRYIRKNQKRLNGLSAIYAARRMVSPLTHQELMDITTLWVDAALTVQDKDLRLMMRLVHLQHNQMTNLM